MPLAIDPGLSNYLYAVPAGWLCLAAALFFLWKRPAANAFLSMSLVGIGGAPLIAGYTYGRISGAVGMLTVLTLLLRRKRRAQATAAFARSPIRWFGGVCLLVSVKILIETLAYGANVARTTFLITALIEVLFPLAVLLLAIIKLGLDSTERDMIIGMVTFPVLMIVGCLPFALQEGWLVSAANGTRVFTFGVADSINTARVLTYGAIASLLCLHLRKRSARTTFVAYSTTLGLTLLLLLTGNRQYLLATVAFLILHAFVLQQSTKLRWVASTIVLALLAYATYDAFVARNDLAIKSRVSLDTLETELASGRGAIWADAFQALLEHPWLGTGFKNFGRDVSVFDGSGRLVTIRDSAHGVFQDVATEHGFPLGIAFLAGFVHLVARSWRAIRREPTTSPRKAWMVGLLALLVPLPFSSAFVNATPVYLLLITAMTRDVRLIRAARSQATT
jgi:O-antigen ligase